MEALIYFVVVSLFSILGYVVKRGFDLISHLAGMPDQRPTSAKEEDKIIDEIPFEYTDESVISDHVLDRRALAEIKADQLRAELAQYTQDPRAGVYDTSHLEIDSTYIPRPTEEYAK